MTHCVTNKIKIEYNSKNKVNFRELIEKDKHIFTFDNEPGQAFFDGHIEH